MTLQPKTAANLGRSRLFALRNDWEDSKDDIMRKAVKKKFETHTDLREMLLETEGESIVENAPEDYDWGCGADGSGI